MQTNIRHILVIKISHPQLLVDQKTQLVGSNHECLTEINHLTKSNLDRCLMFNEMFTCSCVQLSKTPVGVTELTFVSTNVQPSGSHADSISRSTEVFRGSVHSLLDVETTYQMFYCSVLCM